MLMVCFLLRVLFLCVFHDLYQCFRPNINLWPSLEFPIRVRHIVPRKIYYLIVKISAQHVNFHPKKCAVV
jgi:hypothetical protein